MTAPDHEFRAQPVDRDLEGAGLRLHALDWGPAPGPVAVFLHGGGLNAHTWDVVCDLLHEELHCLAIDLRGHGDSDWQPDGNYAMQGYVADLDAAVRSLSLERFILVGMSLGGVVALELAARDRRVLGLVLVDTGPGGSRPAGRRRLGQFMDGPSEFASIDEIIDRAVAFNPRRSPERLRRTLLQNLRQTSSGTWTWKYDPRIRLGSRGRPATHEEVDRWIAERSKRLLAAAREVSCPTLIVRGGDSDMFHDEDAERSVEGFPDARWIRIEGASHTVQSDRPQELAAALREFAAPWMPGAADRR